MANSYTHTYEIEVEGSEGKKLEGEIDFSGNSSYTLNATPNNFPHRLCGLFVSLVDIVSRLNREMGGIKKVEFVKKPE